MYVGNVVVEFILFFRVFIKFLMFVFFDFDVFVEVVDIDRGCWEFSEWKMKRKKSLYRVI